MRLPISTFLLFGTCFGGREKTFTASLARKSASSGWSIPLYTALSKVDTPHWFALRFDSSDFNIHSEDTCPIDLSCDSVSTSNGPLVFSDGERAGLPVPTTLATANRLEFRDVTGSIGLNRASVITQAYAIYLQRSNENTFSIKMVNPSVHPTGVDLPLVSGVSAWMLDARLVREKSGRFLSFLPEDTKIFIDPSVDDISLPASASQHFAGGRTKLAVGIRANRLFVGCKKIRERAGVIYTLKLVSGETEVRIPVKEATGFEPLSDNSILFIKRDLCATNIVFNPRGVVKIGLAILENYDVILNGPNRVVRFVEKGAIPLVPLGVTNPPKLKRFRLDEASIKSDESEMIRNSFEWALTRDAPSDDDFIIQSLDFSKDNRLRKLEVICVKECGNFLPAGLFRKWRGTPIIELGTDGRIKLKEEMGMDCYRFDVSKDGYTVVFSFEHIGTRYHYDAGWSIEGKRFVLTPALGPINPSSDFVIKSSFSLNDFDSRRELELWPIDDSKFELPTFKALYGKPVLTVLENREIRLTAANIDDWKEYGLTFDRMGKKIVVGFTSPFTRFEQFVIAGNRHAIFSFRPLMPDQRSDSEFAVFAGNQPTIAGQRGRFVLRVSPVPGKVFENNPFTPLTEGVSWRGDPVLSMDSTNRWISIKPGSQGPQYTLSTAIDGEGQAILRFTASRARRFVVPDGTRIRGQYENLEFNAVTGPPVEGEFMLTIADEPLGLQSEDGGKTLRLKLLNVVPHRHLFSRDEYKHSLFEPVVWTRWIGKPRLSIVNEKMVLSHEEGDQTVYEVLLEEDWKNDTVEIIFKSHAGH
jgi:hypothetical protein